jgi:arabinan endo-1,5-alpha-L-arabinosidase
MLTRNDIQIRDPFILPVESEGYYYLYGSTDKDVWAGKATGFDVYRSKDLEQWEGPFSAFRPPADFWADKNFWAPEVHFYRDKYYMFATFTKEEGCRGTQILAAEHPLGPFVPHSDGPVTPKDWMCLDGTLFVDTHEQPWMVFCQEWIEVKNGTMCAVPLSEELDRAVGEPILLFSATDAEWVGLRRHPIHGEGFVTDGPYLHRCSSGALLMLWSSHSEGRYLQGIAASESGTIMGPWIQQPVPLYENDGGHGMIFRTFTGQLHLALHTPNTSPNERLIILELQEDGDTIRMKQGS